VLFGHITRNAVHEMQPVAADVNTWRGLSVCVSVWAHG